MTIGCPAALAAPSTKRCTGSIVVDALRTILLSALANQARGSGGVYEYFPPGSQAFARPFQTAARTVAARSLGGTALPRGVDVGAVARILGHTDAHTLSYIASLRRAINEYRAIATQRKPPRGATGTSSARTTRRTAIITRFRLRSGQRRVRVPIRLPPTAITRLARDVGRRTRVPVRILVVFNAPRPVVRFIDMPLRVTRQPTRP